MGEKNTYQISKCIYQSTGGIRLVSGQRLGQRLRCREFGWRFLVWQPHLFCPPTFSSRKSLKFRRLEALITPCIEILGVAIVNCALGLQAKRSCNDLITTL
jgi:hypothetical protein